MIKKNKTELQLQFVTAHFNLRRGETPVCLEFGANGLDWLALASCKLKLNYYLKRGTL